jgi:hypothetical protein
VENLERSDAHLQGLAYACRIALCHGAGHSSASSLQAPISSILYGKNRSRAIRGLALIIWMKMSTKPGEAQCREGLRKDRFPLLIVGLLPLDHKVRLKSCQPSLQGCPWIIHREERHPATEVLDGHTAALESVVLRKSHGLTVVQTEEPCLSMAHTSL